MSAHGKPKARPKIPEARSEYLTTRQMEPNEKGYIGYETIWDEFQKEAEYTVPKRP
jgi:hypothetical protein